MRVGVIALLLGALFFCSCQEDRRIFDVNKELSNGVWKRSNVLTYPVEITDPSQAYDLFYTVRNSIDYPFYNLYLRMVIKDSAATVCLDHNHELYLFHPQTGRPAGKSNFLFNVSLGDLFDQKYPATFKYKFPHAGVYEVEIRQFMRKDEEIPGIYAVGLQIEKSMD